jgi:uncharacterized protein
MRGVKNVSDAPASAPRRKFGGLLVASAALCLNGCSWLATTQRKLVYRPTPGSIEGWESISGQDEPLWLSQPLGPRLTQGVRALWIPQPDPQAPAVLYLHGTFRHMVQNRPKILPIYRAGFSVLAVDYRGWGESTPMVPSEDTIMADAEVAWREFTWRVPQAHRRVLYGHSMGSGVAVELAVRHRNATGTPAYGAVVLESAFTSLPGIARDHGSLGRIAAWITTEQFASIDKIPRVPGPKWFLTGSADNTVPPLHSRRLFDAASDPRSLVVFPGGTHSRMQESDPQRYQRVWTEVAEWLKPPGAPGDPSAATMRAGGCADLSPPGAILDPAAPPTLLISTASPC